MSAGLKNYILVWVFIVINTCMRAEKALASLHKYVGFENAKSTKNQMLTQLTSQVSTSRYNFVKTYELL